MTRWGRRPEGWGYLVGSDASGQGLEDAGTGEDGEHLFMYQIGPDGPQLCPQLQCRGRWGEAVASP